VIYLSDLTLRDGAVYEVNYVHRKPFDAKDGLGKDPIELEQNGVLVDILPDLEVLPGKTAILYVDKSTKNVWYEYVDKPLTREEELEQRVDDLTLQVAQLTLQLQGGTV